METKDYVILIVAIVAASASIVSIFVNIYLSSKKERSNKLWEKELERIFELEENVGVFVDDLIFFRCRENMEKEKFYEKQHYLPNAMGRFRRYPDLHEALRLVSHDALWYFSQDMKHENNEDYNQAKTNLETSYQNFIKACDKVLERH